MPPGCGNYAKGVHTQLFTDAERSLVILKYRTFRAQQQGTCGSHGKSCHDDLLGNVKRAVSLDFPEQRHIDSSLRGAGRCSSSQSTSDDHSQEYLQPYTSTSVTYSLHVCGILPSV